MAPLRESETASSFPLGYWVLRARREGGYATQGDLAQALAEYLGKSVSRQLVSKWERGTGNPDIEQWLGIAAVTRCDWMLDLRGMFDGDPSHLPTDSPTPYLTCDDMAA